MNQYSHVQETGVEIERTLFTNTIIPDDPPAKLLLPVPVSLFSVVLEVLFQRRGMLPRNVTETSVNWSEHCYHVIFGSSCLWVNKEESPVQAASIDLDSCGEMGLLLQRRQGRLCPGCRRLLRVCFRTTMTQIKVNGKPQWLIQARWLMAQTL